MIDDDDFDLIESPLTRTHRVEGHTLRIQIYHGPDEPWILEIVDELGTSTVWEDGFDTDTAALQAALLAIQTEGVHAFLTSVQPAAEDAEPELLGSPAPGQGAPVPASLHDMLRPLSDSELDELERSLLNLDAQESMTLDRLDGFLHALVIGPQTVMPDQWLPKVWAQEDGAVLPPVDSIDQANQLLGLVMRHFNSIVSGFEHSPPVLAPLWPTVDYGDTGEFEDAEMWAYGFTEGVSLCQAAWQALFEHPDGSRWYRPIGLLGADDFSADQDELTRTPEQRVALAAQIEESLTHIHAFWLPLRHAVAERQQARRMAAKVGRNDPCPCGSGKKFKKCCGAASELH
ncbi:UPF0149 family protein [Paucibacter sp. PLA-PC-4]|uniref:UPF0149 family protein n=1 Tax=Paucibacter sp. PLA-PC-4 TaxID=2993655 RepID=UPI00224A5754|nr:UPF0149 family protein [Paucibacter sp. PLA-PC-4]MCX2863618.1 UPF0149 family protein [Paucibacter sp. PLA-PC-4]